MNLRNLIAKKRGLTIILIGVAAVAALGVAAVASIPDSSGVIHACYKSNNGDLRVVESAANCKNNEVAIQWSTTGPQGPQGPQGPTGPQGPQGPAGPSVLGPSGSKGYSVFPSPPAGYVTCGVPGYASVIEIPVTLTANSTIHAFGQLFPIRDIQTLELYYPYARAELLSGATVVAYRNGGRVELRDQVLDGNNANHNSESLVSGPLLGPNDNTIYTASPGTYTLRLIVTDDRTMTSSCGNGISVRDRALLSFQAFTQP